MTAAGGANLTGNVTINVQGTNQLDALAQSIVRATTDVLKLAQSMPTLDAAQQKQIRSMTQQVGLYTKAASLANTWASASLKAAEAEKSQADAAGILTAAIKGTQDALQNLTGTTQRSYDSKTRTIDLSRQNADVLLIEANAAKAAAEAQLLLAKAQTETVAATRLANGQGTPITGYQRAQIALQQQGQAARTAQTAVDNAAKADLAASTAAAKLAQSATNAANADARKAAASEAAATASKNEAVAADSATQAIQGNYFALYQVAAAYALVAKASESVITSAVSTAASFQASFNNVIRTTGLVGDTSEMAQSQVALLEQQLISMSETIPVSLEDVASIAALGGQLGIAAGDIANFTQVVSEFSALTGISANDTALMFGRITNLLGVTTDDYDQLASTILDLGVKSAATEQEIGNTAVSIGATAREAGLATPDILGLSTAFASLKIPPELGRGTLTRLFVQISAAAANGVDGMQDYAKVLGVTANDAYNLQKADPSTFFTDLIQGLGQASANGQDLNTVLGDIGVTNSRDIPVLTRLAQNYNLLANDIQEAQTEMAKAPGHNALAEQANLIFSGLTAKAKEFTNTFRATLGNLGGAALAPLTLALQPLTALVQLFEKLPGVVAAPILAITGFVAVMAAYRAAVALGLAATLAFQRSLAGNEATIGLRSLAIAASQTFGTGAVAARLGAATVVAANEEIGASAGAAATEVDVATQVQIEAQTRLIAMSLRAEAANALLTASTTATGNAMAVASLKADYLVASFGRQGTAASATAAALALDTAALELEAGAATGAAGAAERQAAAQLRATASAIALAPALAADAVAADVLTGSLTLAERAGQALSRVPAIAWITLAVGAVAGIAALSEHLTQSKNQTEELAAAAAKVKSDFLDAVGGVQALQSAVKADTDAAGQFGAQASGAIEQLVHHVDDLHDGTAKVYDVFESLNGAALSDKINTQVVAYSGSVLDAAHNTKTATDAQSGFGTAAGLSADQLERQTVIIGKQTAALAAQALQLKVYGGKDSTGKDVTGLLSPDQVTALNASLSKSGTDLGTVLGNAFKQGTTKGAAGINQAFAPAIAGLQAQITSETAKLNAAKASGDKEAQQSAEIGIAIYQQQITNLNNVTKAFVDQNGVLQDSISQYAATSAIMKAMGVSTSDVVDDTDGMTGALGAAEAATGQLGDTAQTAAQTLSNLASAFGDVISGATDMNAAVGSTQDALDKLGQSIVTNGLDFSNYTEGGRENLSNLRDVVSDYGNELSTQIKQGKLSAETAASQMSSFIHNLVNQLATQGVDTSQIDFLVNYVDQFAANPATLTINADGSQAFQTIQAISSAAAEAAIQLAAIGANWDQGQFRNSSDAAANGAGPSAQGTPTFDQNFRNSSDAANAANTEAAARQKQADAAVAAGKATADAAQAMAIAKEQDDEATAAAQQNSAAQKQAGDDAQAAGKQQADAAKDASDALKQQAQYIQAVGQYYAQLADSAASTTDDTGKVVSALQDLGNAVAVNGTSFDAFSEGGQKNLSSLTGALDAYGASLQTQLNDGSISVDQAGSLFSQFAGGVRQDLLSLGVPAQEINTLFSSLGAGSGWSATTAAVGQYRGVVTGAAADSTAFGDAATAATDKASKSASQLAAYYSAVDDYFKSITTNAFSLVTAEGDVFASIQKLGGAIAQNGTAFNTVTQTGRDNFAALNDVFNTFGANLQARVSAGAITAGQAASQYRTFAAQIYQQLIQLGVKASDISVFFRALGIDPGKTSASSAAVRQYAGVLTAAATAARAAASGTSELGTAMAAAADYADRLNTALDTSFDRLHGLAQAQDAVTSAVQAMSDAYQSNIDKIKQLQDANKGLQADQATAQSAYDEANRKYLLAVKYGQTDAASKYLADRNTASGQITDDTSQIAQNSAQAEELKKYGSSLQGNSKEAIANRASYIALQKTMFDQIDAYAKTGASTQQVAKYTKDLQVQFENAGKAAGYSKADIKTYSDNFAAYATVVQSVPKQVKTTATADTSAATAALNAVPTHGTYTTTAVAETATATRTLAALPDKQDYLVTARVQAGTASAVTGVLAHIPKRADYVITPTVSSAGGGAKGALQRSVGSGAVGKITTAVDALSLKNAKASIASAQIVLHNAIVKVLGVVGLTANTVTTPRLAASSVVAPSAPVQTPDGRLHTGSGAVLWYKGGMPGYAQGGGLLPGTPPANPNADNMLALGPHGMISVRSREYIQPQPSVDYYGIGMMNAIRNRTYPRQGFYAGGQASGGGGSYATGGGVGGGSVQVIAQLSTEDRRMLRRAIDRPIVTVLDGKKVSQSQAQQNAVARKSGANV